MNMNRTVTIVALLFAGSGVALAQTPSPPTDPQSKQQQESPVVKGAGNSNADAGKQQDPPTDPQSKQAKESPVAKGASNAPLATTTTTPTNADPAGSDAANKSDKKGPLQPAQ